MERGTKLLYQIAMSQELTKIIVEVIQNQNWAFCPLHFTRAKPFLDCSFIPGHYPAESQETLEFFGRVYDRLEKRKVFTRTQQ